MKRSVGSLLTIAGASLVAISAIALYNSALDSRLLLAVALGAAGLLLAPMGLRAIFGEPQAA